MIVNQRHLRSHALSSLSNLAPEVTVYLMRASLKPFSTTQHAQQITRLFSTINNNSRRTTSRLIRPNCKIINMSGINTSTSTLGIAFDGGVIIAADTLVSYGSLARFKNFDRIKVINKNTVISGSGDLADYQWLTNLIEQKRIRNSEWADGIELAPRALHSWVTRVAYNKRSKMDPIRCEWIIGGLQMNEETGKMEPFLGYCDKLGTAYKDRIVTTGFGRYLALPIFREVAEALETLPTEQQARELVKKCMEVLYYRDARSINRYKLVVVKEEGVSEEGPIEFKGDWDIAEHVLGY